MLNEMMNFENGQISTDSVPGEMRREVVYSGMVGKVLVGETVAIGDLLYLDKTDDEFKKANAALAAAFDEGARCIALEVKGNGTYCKCFFFGFIRMDSISGLTLTPGDIVYTGETAGAMTKTAPATATDKVQKVATALSATALLFQPSLEYTTV
jgi:hypothetical protein